MAIYFDNAATTPLSKEVLESMLPFYTDHFGNASSSHSFGRVCKAAIENSRRTIAQYLKCKPSEIFFTGSGTEANNTAIKCSVRDLGVTRIISSEIEHHCGLHTIEEMAKYDHVSVEYVPLKEKGHFDLDALDQILGTSTEKTLVSLMHANNELGNLMDLEKAAAICLKHNALFHTDTVQTIAHCPFDLTNTPITFLSGSGHKFHGPKGVGFLYIRSQTNIQPFIHGGAQERNMRAGTENVAGIVGLGTALKIAYDHLEADATHMQSIKDYMVAQLTASIPDIRFNTDLDNSLFTVLNTSLPEAYSNEMTLFNLDLKGIACSGGSACSSGAAKGSHVLAAIHHPTERKAVRFSFSKYNTKAEVDEAVEKVAELAGMSVEG